MLRVAFAGTPEFAVPTLQALADSHHTLVGVLTQPDRPAGRGRELKRSPVKDLGLRLGLSVSQPAALRDDAQRAELASWQADVLVVAAYGLILPVAALTLPRLGCVNVHASLLPRWRGAAPVQRAILAGDVATGVTIMQMAAGLDTGPILAQSAFDLTGRETSQALLERLSQTGARLLIETLDRLEAGTVTPKEQSSDGVTYAGKLAKQEGQVDWQRSAVEISRQVRAFNPWPIAQTLFQGQQLRLWQAVPASRGGQAGEPGQVLGMDAEQLLVRCGEGSLGVERLQLAGKRAMSAREFASGRALSGMHFG
ncbi:MAG TPA: methionyl-tRNA formyltransferase [Steroidobacteraceae bacterium]|jgi:methionyl-tRNA formyltransferase|nr:methionyl-tRNA formyltransferase [Steroidobacteraceae bacterium]